MKTTLNERSLDWALTHLTRFCDSDCFPFAFEYKFLPADWPEIKARLLDTDLESYAPRPPLVRFAPKPNGAFRIVHRLDPLDSLIYTALTHEIHESLEDSKGRDAGDAIRSLRIEPAKDGSFFSTSRNGWQHHIERTGALAGQFQTCGATSPGGFVLITDIHDFFNQIQPRLLVHVLSETKAARPELVQALGRFLHALSAGTGRGIPTGPGASTVLSERILSEIDKTLLKGTSNFTRWGDDYRIFYRTRADAEKGLNDLSSHIRAAHGFSLAAQKTRILPVDEFLASHYKRHPVEATDAAASEIKLNEIVGESTQPGIYAWMTTPIATPQPMSVHRRLLEQPEFQTLGSAYLSHFDRAVDGKSPDLLSARRILRKAARYRIPTILPSVLAHFDRMAPVIREAVIYLRSVLDEEKVKTYAVEIRTAWEKKVHVSTYINEWMSYLFTKPCFNEIGLPAHYNEIPDIRSKALIALRKKDVEWIRKNAAHLDAMDLWDKRAVLYACSVLPAEERANVAKTVRHGIMERMIARHLAPGEIKAPCNYPSYGDKIAGPGLGGGYVADGPGVGGGYIVASPGNDPAHGDKVAMARPHKPAAGGQVAGPGVGGGYVADGPGSGGGYVADGPGLGGGYVVADGPGAGGGYVISAPDNYPAYGAKSIAPTPRWIMESIPELDELLEAHGAEIMVSLQDSVDSGNCIAGSHSYRSELLARLGLPPDTATVPAKAFLAYRDDPIARRAARAAAYRYRDKISPGRNRRGW